MNLPDCPRKNPRPSARISFLSRPGSRALPVFRSGSPWSVLFTLFLVLPATAADRYVSTDGQDTNPGTFDQPWRTIQKAANTVVAGDTVHIRGNGGVYTERVTISNKDGTAVLPIVFKTYAGDALAVVDQIGVTPPNGTSALLTIQNSDHVTIEGLELRNYKTSGTNNQQKQQLPAGIYVTGDGDGIQIRNCKVHGIWQSCATRNDFGANGFGIAVYGTSSTAINNLVLDGNEVYDLRTGASESVVLNGNVTNFTVSNNTVHDCNNIGIDFIGFEGTAPTEALDQARNGICSGNEVYNVDSKFNPAYGGNFTVGGGDATRAAPGLYVDGGRDIVLERNHVHACNFAVSVGSEHLGKVVTSVTVRNNILHHCHVGGIVIGGSASDNGGADNCQITNNTIYDNDTVGFGGGQVMIQNHVTNTTIQRNIIASTADFAQFVLKDNTTGNFAAGAIDWNLYKGTAGGDFEFIWDGTAYSSFAGWQNADALAKDSHSTLLTGPLNLTNDNPTVDSPPEDFALTSASPAKDTGDSAAIPFTPAAGEKDFGGQSRVTDGRVDIGADEFLTPWQAWRDTHFGLPDGGSGAEAGDDPDSDRAANLVEYSQGMDPNVADPGLLPSLSVAGGALRFTYRKAAPDLAYTVQENAALSGAWTTLDTTESTDGAGTFWREAPLGGATHFFRLHVALP